MILTTNHTIHNCDSNIEIHLHINDTFRSVRYDTICRNATFSYTGNNGNVINYTPNRTNFHDTVILTTNRTIHNCDSNIEIRLHINDTFRTTRYDTICRSDVFTYGNNIFTYRPTDANLYDTTIIYRHPTVRNCDSNVVIRLHINDTFRTFRYDTICRDGMFTYGNNLITYRPTDANLYDTTIMYLHQSVRNCDSNVVIRLHINDTFRTILRDTICRNATFSYTGNNNNIINYTPNREGFHDTVILTTNRTIHGCDSNIEIRLHINDTFRTILRDTICRNATFSYTGNNNNVISYTPNRENFHDTVILTTNRTIHGCDSNIEIRLHINDTFRTTRYDTICRNATFSYTGNNNNVINYTPNRDNFHDTVILTTDRTVHGCDSNIVIRLHINDTFRTILRDTICRNATFSYTGNNNNVISYTPNRDNFHDTVILTTNRTVHGCDSNIEIRLHIKDTFHRDTNIAICRDGAFVYGNNLINYTPNRENFHDTLIIYTHTAVNGCDSNIYFHVHVNDTFHRDTNIAICRDGAFVYGNNLINYTPNRTNFSDTLIIYTHTTVNGCDSNIYFHVHVNDTFHRDTNIAICRDGAFVYGNNLINYTPNRTNLTDTLITYTHTTIHGCDSNIFFFVHINDTFRDIEYDTICRSDVYDDHGINYTPSAHVYDTVLINRIVLPTGCDSTIELHLHVNDTFRDVVYDTICRSEIYRGHGIFIIPSATVRDTSRIRRIILPTGCDSTIEVRLHVYDTFRTVVYDTICRGDVYSNHGIVCTPSANVYDTLLINRITLPVTGCDSVIELHLHVKDTFRTVRYDTICAGATFTYVGTSYTNTTTFVYRHTAQNGCDSNVVVNLTVNDTVRDTIYRTVCAGTSFDTLGQSYFFQGYYTHHLRDNSTGCFYNLVIDLTVNDTIRDTIYRTVCAGTSFDTNDISYYYQGVYTQHLRQPDSCFNNLVIFLSVNDTLRDTIEQNICAGQTYTHNNVSYSIDGWYRQDLRTNEGCDSILHIHLIVSDTLRDTLFYSVCAGKTVVVNNETYIYSGWYRQDLRTNEGCDSILYINVYVEDTLREHVYDTICYGNTYLFNGSMYSAPGVYRHSLRTAEGCDSIAILHLHVHDTIMVHWYDTLCVNGIYTFFDTVIGRTGVYYHRLPRAVTGCDSTIALHLFIRDSIVTNIYDTICVNSSYNFGGRILTTSGRYARAIPSIATGCDSVIYLNLTVLDFPILELADSGGYCVGGVATLKANTNANQITWSSFPNDTSLNGQEHNFVIYVTPQRYTEYIATVDIQPYDCFSSDVIAVHKPTPVEARILANPLPITADNLQTSFTDVSIGNIVSRKWMLHEENLTSADRIYMDDSIVYYTPVRESDSLEVTLWVANNMGCRDSITKIYPILKGDIFVPNAFAPGTRGFSDNHIFKVVCNDVIEYEIFIYSRAGLLVFHSTDPTIGWDGTYKYQDCVGGSYVYIVRYKTQKHPEQTIEKKGSVLLVR